MRKSIIINLHHHFSKFDKDMHCIPTWGSKGVVYVLKGQAELLLVTRIITSPQHCLNIVMLSR